MTELSGWFPLLHMAILLMPIVIGLVGVSICFYVACTREFYTVISLIYGELGLEQKKYFGSLSLKTRWLMVGGICGLLIIPAPHIRKGLLNVEQLGAFPVRLKKKLLASLWLTFIGFTGMVIVAALIKLQKR